ncbi:MAG: chemotaxis response regulator protein-glutamate methylesterase [Ignavibacteriae bacterium]|nr:chemotaxis response regulator protein-glutamate methylesterase [Ignavibacteriota bacterium]
MTRTINCIVVDDSAFMRKSLAMMLESDPQIKVVATARDGKEGIEKIREFSPDLVTMDIEMPGMDGLTALGIIMKECPLPVLMVSSLTTDGAKSTLDALNLGAVDFIPKELSFVSLDIVKIKAELISKVKSIVQSRSLQFRLQRIRAASQGIRDSANATKGGHAAPAAPARPVAPAAIARRKELRAVVLGISTGGPFALLQTIPKLPKDFPLGIAVVQHMPPRFTKSMAERLDGLSQVSVKEAEDGDALLPGRVLIAPGGQHLTFKHQGSEVVARITAEPADTLYRPCADVMMLSALQAFNAPLLGVIMTGMGKDGLEGLRKIKQKGGMVVAQNEETCVVYGMPKAAVDDGIADLVLPLEEIPGALTKITRG